MGDVDLEASLSSRLDNDNEHCGALDNSRNVACNLSQSPGIRLAAPDQVVGCAETTVTEWGPRRRAVVLVPVMVGREEQRCHPRGKWFANSTFEAAVTSRDYCNRKRASTVGVTYAW